MIFFLKGGGGWGKYHNFIEFLFTKYPIHRLRVIISISYNNKCHELFCVIMYISYFFIVTWITGQDSDIRSKNRDCQLWSSFCIIIIITVQTEINVEFKEEF